MGNCKVIAITNQKGGVGKTTTTVNLGVGLAKQGKRVMLLDADPQGSLTVSLGVKNPDDLPVSLANIMQAVIDDKSIPDKIGILHHDEGVDLLPSNIELSGTEIALFNTMSREYVLRSYLETVKKHYDYILIDYMPSLGMMTVNALSAADSVIIPSQPSFLSTKGLNLLMRSIARVKKQINPRLRIDGILLTMVDNRTNNAKAIISYLRYCYELCIIVKRPASVKRVSFLLREDVAKLDQLIAQTRFLGRTGMETIDELTAYREGAAAEMAELTEQRQALRNRLRRLSRQGDTLEADTVRAQIGGISQKLKTLRRDMALCDGIAERSGQVRENLALLKQQQKIERKERLENELFRRRGGTGRANDAGGR